MCCQVLPAAGKFVVAVQRNCWRSLIFSLEFEFESKLQRESLFEI
jgi:hypothetical protein